MIIEPPCGTMIGDAIVDAIETASQISSGEVVLVFNEIKVRVFSTSDARDIEEKIWLIRQLQSVRDRGE